MNEHYTNGIIDLHVHSNCSDGTFSPSELVAYALTKGLRAFALTDHDTFHGVPEAIEAAMGTSLEVIPGIEFSTVWNDFEVHVVGIDLDTQHPVLRARMDDFCRSRDQRNQSIIDAMNHDGIPISINQLRSQFGNTILTRAHFARYLFEHGYADSLKDAFLKYLAEGCKYHIPRQKISPVEVVELIGAAGGIPILAHPMLYHMSSDELESLIVELKQAGLLGIEVLYSTYTDEEQSYVASLASRFDLLWSGGSDFHGEHKPGLDLASGYGNLHIDASILTELRKRRQQHGTNYNQNILY